jgi:hypothetical protein
LKTLSSSPTDIIQGGKNKKIEQEKGENCQKKEEIGKMCISCTIKEWFGLVSFWISILKKEEETAWIGSVFKCTYTNKKRFSMVLSV